MVTCNSFIRTNTQTYVWTSPYRTTTTLGVGGRRQCVLFRVLIIMLNSCSAWKCRHHFIFRCIACSSHAHRMLIAQKHTHDAIQTRPDQMMLKDEEKVNRRFKWEMKKEGTTRMHVRDVFISAHGFIVCFFSSATKMLSLSKQHRNRTCAYLCDMFGNLWICRGNFDKYENVFIKTASHTCSPFFSSRHDTNGFSQVVSNETKKRHLIP